MGPGKGSVGRKSECKEIREETTDVFEYNSGIKGQGARE
jgi:hypothetical protein